MAEEKVKQSEELLERLNKLKSQRKRISEVQEEFDRL